ncbi:MAG: vWA domain-containing protein [Pseudomonadales bacterium]
MRAGRVMFCLLLALVPVGVRASAAPDVRVVLEVSARMGQADPANARGKALGMLLQMLPEDGRAGVWTFGKYVNMLVKYGASDALWKTQAALKTAAVADVGLRADLLAALEAATWDRADPDGERHVLLLSDGRIDVDDDAAVDAARADELLTRLLPELIAAHIRVHTLALTAEADVPFLQQLAQATGGYFARITAETELNGYFLRVFDRVAPGTRLPADAVGGFLVDPGIQELTILRSGARLPDPVSLLDPQGREYTRTTPRSQIRWHVDDGYELISVSQPVPGRWRFRGVDPGRLRVHAFGDLDAQLVDLPGSVFPGALQSYRLQLTSAGEPVTDAQFLDLLRVSASLSGPRGETPVLAEREGAGWQVHLLDLDEAGEYLVKVQIEGKTFRRELATPFSVRNPLSMEIRPDTSGAVFWIELNAPDVDQRTVQVAARLKHPPGAARVVPVQRLPGGLWKLVAEDARGLLEASLHIQGNYLNGKEFLVSTAPVRVTLPMTVTQHARFDLRGRALVDRVAPDIDGGAAADAAAGSAGGAVPPAPAVSAVQAAAPGTEPEATVPLWFAALLGVVNLLVGAMLWWLVRPVQPRLRLETSVARLRALAQLDPPAAEAEAAGQDAVPNPA